MSEDQTNKQEVAPSIAQLRVKPEWARFQVIPIVDNAFTKQRMVKLDTWTGETWERTDREWFAITTH